MLGRSLLSLSISTISLLWLSMHNKVERFQKGYDFEDINGSKQILSRSDTWFPRIKVSEVYVDVFILT